MINIVNTAACYLFLIFRLHQVACGILTPLTGIESVPSALGVHSLNHWIAREVSGARYIRKL